jgi:hypothetical protein
MAISFKWPIRLAGKRLEEQESPGGKNLQAVNCWLGATLLSYTHAMPL